MIYDKFALCGFIILYIIFLYFLYKNVKKNENKLIIFGSLLITIGYFFAAQEKYNYINNKNLSVNISNISKSHLILGAFGLLSFIFPINNKVKQTDVFGIIGHFILINSNFGYSEIANICLTIYYSLYTYRHASKNELLSNIQGIGGGLVLLYYIKKVIDNWYKKKEKEIDICYKKK